MEKVVKEKKVWRGAFNYPQTVKILYRKAYTERQAWALMCKSIAAKDHVPFLSVMDLFDGSRDNFKIEIEPAT